jgi:hypothetical protein
MPSTLAHAASASLVAVTIAHIHPNETSYILAALFSASVLDLDHLYYMVRDRHFYQRFGYRGNLHYARSAAHEMLGLLITGVASGLLFLVDQKLARVVFIALTIHLVQDWVVGNSRPFMPVDSTPVQFFSLTLRHKVIIDIIILMVSGALWTLYLAGDP